MLIKKEYKFYASHRNQELVGSKCERPHGHDYKVFLTFNVVRKGNITTLFDDFDKVLEPMFKDEFDHRMIIDESDMLLKYLKQFETDNGQDLGLKIIPFASSVENICYLIFKEIMTRFNFDLQEIHLQETRTATVIYTRLDFITELESFN